MASSLQIGGQGGLFDVGGVNDTYHRNCGLTEEREGEKDYKKCVRQQRPCFAYVSGCYISNGLGIQESNCTCFMGTCSISIFIAKRLHNFV